MGRKFLAQAAPGHEKGDESAMTNCIRGPLLVTVRRRSGRGLRGTLMGVGRAVSRLRRVTRDRAENRFQGRLALLVPLHKVERDRAARREGEDTRAASRTVWMFSGTTFMKYPG